LDILLQVFGFGSFDASGSSVEARVVNYVPKTAFADESFTNMSMAIDV